MIYIVLLLALVLRLVSVDQSFWLDEATSALVARDMSYSQIIGQFLPGDFHPPLYYFILRAWAGVFGTSELAIRSLSIIAGVGTVWIVYRVARGLKWRSAGLAALLLATAPLHIYYSQEARMYSLAAFFVSSSIYFFVKVLKEPDKWQWFGFGFSIAAFGLTHYLALLMIPVFWTSALVAKRKLEWWRKFVAAHIVLVVTWIWWFPTFLRQLGKGLGVEASSPGWWQVLGRTTPKEIALLPTKFIFGRIDVDPTLTYALIIGGVGLVFAFLLFKTLKKYKESRLIWIWLALPTTLAALVGLRVPVFSYFRLLFVLPAFYLLVAEGIFQLSKKWIAPVIIFILIVNLGASSMYLFNKDSHREDWKGLVSFVEGEKREDNSITLFVSDSQMEVYNYYAPGARISGPDGLGRDFDTIWLMRYVQPIFDAKDELRFKVEDLGYQKTKEYDFNGVVVWRYER